MPELNLIDLLGSYGTPTLFEVASEVRTMPSNIAPLYRPINLFGPAYPVLAVPGDNLAVHLALAEAPAGSVLVVATGGATQYGFWGEITTAAAQARAIRGLVTDGAVRDTRAIQAHAFPVFCSAVAIPGTVKLSPGMLNQPIVIGGTVIRPGDLIVGDEDGVVIIPPAIGLEVLEKAQARAKTESEMLRRLSQGELTLDLLDLRKRLAGGKPG